MERISGHQMKQGFPLTMMSELEATVEIVLVVAVLNYFLHKPVSVPRNDHKDRTDVDILMEH